MIIIYSTHDQDVVLIIIDESRVLNSPMAVQAIPSFLIFGRMSYFKPAVALKLDDFRGTLMRLEETIIFALIERAQFAHNAKVYRKGEG